MELGYLSHVAGDRSPRQIFRETVELAVTAEAHGFDAFWVAQHHGGHLDGLLPSPLVLLAAVASRTSTLRLGTAVVAAPLEEPRRLAEDVVTLDVLADGRLELGIGAGADAGAAAAFDHDHERRHEECAETADRLQRLLRGDDGGRGLPLVPDAPGLVDRLWWATSSVGGVDAAAARGIGLMSGKPGWRPSSSATGPGVRPPPRGSRCLGPSPPARTRATSPRGGPAMRRGPGRRCWSSRPNPHAPTSRHTWRPSSVSERR